MGECPSPLGLRMSKERRMALIPKGGAVFLHIPKTDSNWVTTTLEKAGLALSRYVRKMSQNPGEGIGIITANVI